MVLKTPTGKELIAMAKDIFQTDKVTPEQLTYVMDMLKPSSYALRNHTIKGSPMTFHISGRDSERALAHRP